MSKVASWPSAAFSDGHLSESQVNIVSTWKLQTLQLVDRSILTDPVPVSNVHIQVIEREAKGAQTVGVLPQTDAAVPADVQQFLNRAAPVVLEELAANSTAAQNISAHDYHTHCEEKEVCQYSLQAFPPDHPTEAQLEITSVSWSCTGQTIALGYGRHNITGWCTSHGAVATWNLSREEVHEGKPDVLIDVDSSITSCAFHPQHPALIAGGTFNGVLHVWDLSQEEDMLQGTSDSLADTVHLEPINAVYWQHSRAQANRHAQASYAYRIITLGADGKVLVWLWHKLSTPVYGYELSWPQPGLSRNVVWGATCMSFQKPAAGDATVFMTGTEGGTLLKCYLDYNEVMSKDFPPGPKSSLRSPVKDAGFEAHAGMLAGVDCSRFHSDVFATCGADGTVRVFNLLKKQSLMLLAPCSCPLHGVQWSPSRPLVLGTASSDGRVYIYDLAQDSRLLQPAATLHINYGESTVNSIAFNSRRPGLIAAADSQTCQVWKLPSSLVYGPPGETTKLKQSFAAIE